MWRIKLNYVARNELLQQCYKSICISSFFNTIQMHEQILQQKSYKMFLFPQDDRIDKIENFLSRARLG